MEQFYRSYFENLASKSKLIKSFYYINDRYNLASFDNAVKSVQGQTPTFLLEQYSYDVAEGSAPSRNYIKTLNGQFNILLKTTAGQQSSIEAARATGEMIADRYIGRMRRDFDSGQPIILDDDTQSGNVFYKVSAKCEPIGPINADYYGIACLFSWYTSFGVPVSSDDWTDID